MTRLVSAIITTVVIGFSIVGGTEPSAPQTDLQKLVNTLSGTWSVSETSDNGTSQGEEIWRAGPGGMPLVEEFRATTSSGEKLNDYAVFWWDAKAKKYQGIWCAHFNDQGCTSFDVKWHGDQIELTGEYESKGSRIAWKEVFELTTPGTFTQTLYMGAPGEELKSLSTIRAKRVRND